MVVRAEENIGTFSLSKFKPAQQRPWSDSDLKNTCEQFPPALGLPKFKSEMRCGPESELGLNFRDRSRVNAKVQ